MHYYSIQKTEFFSFFRKLRDEYDKLEGALRKLGVDPENVIVDQNVVGRNVVDDFEDEENLFDDDDYSDYEEETHEVIQLQRCQIAKLPNCQIAKLPNCQITMLPNCHNAKFDFKIYFMPLQDLNNRLWNRSHS